MDQKKTGKYILGIALLIVVAFAIYRGMGGGSKQQGPTFSDLTDAEKEKVIDSLHGQSGGTSDTYSRESITGKNRDTNAKYDAVVDSLTAQ